MREFDGGQDDVFSLFLGAGLDHHDAVFVADDHDVERGGSALGIGGLMTNSPSTRPTRTAPTVALKGNVRERREQRRRRDADHVRIVFLVGREDQRE